VRNDWIFKEAPPFVEAFKAKFKHEFAMLLQFFLSAFVLLDRLFSILVFFFGYLYISSRGKRLLFAQKLM
jgi:hypothetical protein